jgi:hypothetical protein
VTRQLPHYPQCVAASGCLALKQWGLAAVAIVGLLVVVPMSGGVVPMSVRYRRTL